MTQLECKTDTLDYADWDDVGWKDAPIDLDYTLEAQKQSGGIYTRWQFDQKALGYWQLNYRGPGCKVERTFLPCKGIKLQYHKFRLWFERVRMQWLT